VTTATDAQTKAVLLRSLHRPGSPLVLPNAWDVMSARLLTEAGFPAVATSSAAVAFALGYEDGEAAPAEQMLAAASRIAHAVQVPVTADLEAGYGLAPEELVERTLAAGVVGCNLEDTDHGIGALGDASRQAERLAAVRAAGDAAGVPLVINARVDVFVRASGRPESELVDDAVARGRAYLDAGADCVYPIGAAEPATIARLVAEVGGPVNALTRPGAPGVRHLAELGLARVSFGSGLYRTTEAWLRTYLARLVADELEQDGRTGQA
jgi:2-methylisocitrate lyase-like PEP mutase family enzyme